MNQQYEMEALENDTFQAMADPVELHCVLHIGHLQG